MVCPYFSQCVVIPPFSGVWSWEDCSLHASKEWFENCKRMNPYSTTWIGESESTNHVVGGKYPEQFRKITEDYFPKQIITSITSLHTYSIQCYTLQFYHIWKFYKHYYSKQWGFPIIYVNTSPLSGNNGPRLHLVIHQIVDKL